eukprot:IDg6288t1
MITSKSKQAACSGEDLASPQGSATDCNASIPRVVKRRNEPLRGITTVVVELIE